MHRFLHLSFTVLCVFVLFPATGTTQNYLWPTDASHYLTSSFGEYRARHFHAGIDIKTWSKPGYRAIAIDDGYIWRVRTSDTGYGKALYLKTTTGDIAVYAHLDRFTDEIADYVRDLQERQSSYDLDHFPPRDRFTVERGEVIAYTGNTGTRYPHLHFEIRNGKNEPVNPLSQGLSIQDVVPPVPQAVAVTPRHPQTRVNGDYTTDILSVRAGGDGKYYTDPVTVTGTFGLEVKAYDGVRSVYNKYNIYRADLHLADSLLFSLRYNGFNYHETGLILLERNYELRREGRGRFQRLYKTRFTRDLPFYLKNLTGEIRLPPGRDTLTLELSDYNGNRTLIRIPVISQPVLDYHVSWKPTTSGEMECSVTPVDSSTAASMRFYSVTDQQGLTKTTPQSTVHRADTAIFTLAESADTASFLLRTNPGEPGVNRNYFSQSTTLPGKTELTWEFTPRGMIGRLTNSEPVYANLQLEILSAKHDTLIPLHSDDFRTWTSPPVDTDILGNTALFLSNGERVHSIPLGGHTMARASESSRYTSPDSMMQLHVPARSLYYPSLIWADRAERSAGVADVPTWRFRPRTLPFRNPATIRVKVPEVPYPKHQLGIYYSEDNETWEYLPGKFSPDSSYITGEILSLESFTVQRDNTPPVMYALDPEPGATLSGGSPETLTMRVQDKKSGIPGRKSLQLLIDGTPVIFEFNPITRILTYRPRETLQQGEHTVQLQATDAAGNSSRISYNFMIQ